MSDIQDGLVVLTVAYDSKRALLDLAKTLGGQIVKPALWLIVNNGSCDVDPLEIESELNFVVISGKEGAGFAYGCNCGLDYLSHQGWMNWVWLLNPDTLLLDQECLQNLLIKLKTIPSYSIVGTGVIAKDGLFEQTAGWIEHGFNFRSRRVNRRRHQVDNISVDWVSGCSLLLKPSAHDIQPEFDTSFPLYYEDIDFCLRLSSQGSPILWLPSITVEHKKGEGSTTSMSRRLRLSSCSYTRFLQRHLPSWVFLLRSARMVLYAILRLPITPLRSLGVLQGWIEALRKPIQ